MVAKGGTGYSEYTERKKNMNCDWFMAMTALQKKLALADLNR